MIFIFWVLLYHRKGILLLENGRWLRSLQRNSEISPFLATNKKIVETLKL